MQGCQGGGSCKKGRLQKLEEYQEVAAGSCWKKTNKTHCCHVRKWNFDSGSRGGKSQMASAFCKDT